MSEVSVAIYRPRDGRGAELTELLKELVDTLVAENVVSHASQCILLRSFEDGAHVVMTRWASPQIERRAQDNPTLNAMWARIEDVAEQITLGELEEAEAVAPSFERID